MRIFNYIKNLFSNFSVDREKEKSKILYEHNRREYVMLWNRYRDGIIPIVISNLYDNRNDFDFHEQVIAESEKIVELFVRKNFEEGCNDRRTEVIKELLENLKSK